MTPMGQNDLLPQFFGCYFHEDWDLDGDDTKSVIELYLTQTEGSSVPLQVATKIDELLASVSSDAELATKLFEEFGCNYNPSADGLTVRAWLRDISVLLRSK